MILDQEKSHTENMQYHVNPLFMRGYFVITYLTISKQNTSKHE